MPTSSQAATQQYEAAAAAGASADGSSTCQGCAVLKQLAEAVVQQGCCGEEEGLLQVMKPFLQGCLSSLVQIQGTSR